MTQKEVNELEKAYSEADAEGKEIFLLDGREWLTGYAKYVIQYINIKKDEEAT